MTNPDAIEKIRTEIILSGRDTRYKIEAYNFVLQGLNFYHVKTGERRHFSGQELAKGFVDFAYKQYGLLAQTVLASWGIRTTNDFGYIVYNLIGINLIRKQQSDCLEDFFDAFDIQEYLSREDPFIIDKSYIKSIKGA